MGRPESITVDVREMPHVRRIAEFMCEGSSDTTEELQHNLWKIDAMATADVQTIFLAMQEKSLAE